MIFFLLVLGRSEETEAKANQASRRRTKATFLLAYKVPSSHKSGHSYACVACIHKKAMHAMQCSFTKACMQSSTYSHACMHEKGEGISPIIKKGREEIFKEFSILNYALNCTKYKSFKLLFFQSSPNNKSMGVRFYCHYFNFYA